MTTRIPWAMVWPFVLAALPAQADAAPVVQKQGTCFVVHCHGGDEELAAQALAAVEPVWPIVAAAFGVPDQEPAKPLAVHLYRTIAGYQAAERALTAGKFQRNLAMYHWDSQSAHVALQPPVQDATLRALGLPGLTIELLAWEATHVARAEVCPNFRSHPMWLVDGLASNTARQVAATLLTGGSDTATMATDLVLVQRLQQQKKLPTASAILADQIDDLPFYERYATRAVFFRFLGSEHGAARGQVLATVRSTGGGDGLPAKVQAAAKTAFGAGLDAAFAKFVAAQQPQWWEVWRSLVPAGKAWQQIAFPDKNAIAWRQEPVRGGGLALGGRLRILPADGTQMNVLFGRTGDGDFYSVAFVADFGCTVFAYAAKGDAWQRLGDANAPGLRLGIESTFAIVAKGTDLRLELDGQSWTFGLPRALPAEVLWGLGAQAGRNGAATGSAGLWFDITAAPTKPERRR